MENVFNEGSMFLARWLHFLAGVVWIGTLYYFNFMQGAFMAEVDAATKSNILTKMLPRAMWWFRWGAKVTFLTGLFIILAKGHQAGHGIYLTAWGTTILVGALLGTVMYLNVWCVIWPAPKVVIKSATQVAGGGQALPEAPQKAAKALLASRTNTMFSIPMLFFMGAASHYPFPVAEGQLGIFWAIIGLIVLGLEANALKGKLGPLTTVKGVISCGFTLTAIIYAISQIFSA